MSEGSEIGESDLTMPDARAAASWSDADRSALRAGSPSSETVTKPRGSSPPARPQTESQFRTTERDKILHALTSCNWNRAQAAKLVGLPRRTFYRRLKEYGILD
jgi:transcriptional regulator of acetoin/glycerol metabolism